MLNKQIEPIKRSTLTVHEVAEYLGVSSDMIYILCREKRIAHFRIGRRILFKKGFFVKWCWRMNFRDIIW